jgi:hemoglobin/transferrin/lactoferrin receptor protein
LTAEKLVKMKKAIIILGSFFSLSCYSQTEIDTVKAIKLDELVLNPLKHLQSKRTIAQQVESISKKEIEFSNNPTSADLLANTGKLTIQKSQQGGGSPVIRGFEASRILLIVDGVRMNNLIYRAGHLQNLITVDKNMLEKVDVLFGPSSTIYGSDALGGAIYLQTKEAKLLSQNESKKISGTILSNYSSVNEGKSIHLDLNLASPKWATLSSFSFNEFGDLKMGRTKNGSNDYFGERFFYVETINGVDQQVANDNKYVQKFSGYKQYDFMQKVLFQQNTSTKHSLNLQYSTTSDIPRYDRLTEVTANGILRYAVWNYGPQKRFLSVYKLSKEKVFSKTNMNLNLSYQNIEESRINRNFGNVNEKSRIEKVSALALNSDFDTKIGTGNLIYGIDLYSDKLNSFAFQKNSITGVKSDLDTRYPDGKNTTVRAEGFLSFNNNFNPETSYNISARAGYTTLKSEIETNYFNLPFTTIKQNNFTYSGAVGLVNNPSKDIKLAFNLASAFRVPNIDDLSKIFESQPGTLIVPNENLKPEKAITADLSITFWHGNRFQFENVFFIAKLYDAIQTDTFTFNGQSTIMYEGEDSVVLANQNQGIGHLAGYSSVLKAYITKAIVFVGTFNFTHGSIHNDSGSFPLDHIAPINGKVGLNYESKKVNLELYMLYNGKKGAKEYSPSGEDNLQYATAYGAPSWQTYNIKSAFSILKNAMLFAGVENLFDIQYRTFSSGINAPGRNIYIGTKYNF